MTDEPRSAGVMDRTFGIQKIDREFVQYMMTVGFEEKEDLYDTFIVSNDELSSKKPVSPQLFQKLLDEHLEPVIYLFSMLASVLDQYMNFPDDETALLKQNEVEELRDAGNAAIDKYLILLLQITGGIISSFPRVEWKKHGLKGHQNALAKWLKQKHQYLTGLAAAESNIRIKSQLNTIKGLIALAIQDVLTMSNEQEFTTQGKRELEHDNREGDNGNKSRDEPPRKKPRHKKDWKFRDKKRQRALGLTFIKPRPEAPRRLSRDSLLGSNYFKTMLGSGLTAEELSESNKFTVESGHGILALKYASTDGQFLLRGGGQDDDSDASETSNRRIRTATKLRFRDPATLWKELIEDATYPRGVFAQRVEEQRPPMADPDRVGEGPFSRHKEVMSKISQNSEWEKVQKENDTATLRLLAREYSAAVTDGRRRARDFIYHNPEGRIFPERPKLNQPEGRDKDKEKRRHRGLHDKDFAKPIGYAFRARMYQILRLAVFWRLYLVGACTLQELLAEEHAHLEVWDQHEELYMEWENCRWFVLRKQIEIESLEYRYTARELLRDKWEKERQNIDEAIALLMNDPEYYERLSEDNAEDLDAPENNAGRKSLELSGKEENDDVESMSSLFGPNEDDDDLGFSVNDFNDDEDNKDDDQRNLDYKTTDAQTQTIEKEKQPTANPQIQDLPNNIMYNPSTVINNTTVALELLERTRDTYDAKLTSLIEENAKLDANDPGNHAQLQRNNIDIIAKQQIVGSLDSEIHNLRRSTDPLNPKSYGQGARRLPPEEGSYEWHQRFTTEIPRKPDVPLGVTSLGLGPMPGQHPIPTDPRIIVGAGPNLGHVPTATDSGVEEEQKSTIDSDNSILGTRGQSASVLTEDTSKLGQLRDLLRKRGEAEVMVRRMTRLQSDKVTATPQSQRALNSARTRRGMFDAKYKVLYATTDDDSIRSRADALELEHRRTQAVLLKRVDAEVDSRIKRAHNEQAKDEKKEAVKQPKDFLKRRQGDDIQDPTTAEDESEPAPPTPSPKPPRAVGGGGDAAAIKAAEDQAYKNWTLWDSQLKAAQQRAKDATRSATAARVAAVRTNDVYLRKLAAHTRRTKAEADAKLLDCETRALVGREALAARRSWAISPAETTDELRRRLEKVSADFDAWRREWDHEYVKNEEMLLLPETEKDDEDDEDEEEESFKAGLRRANDRWVVEVTALMYEAYKAIGVDLGLKYWADMYDGFWEVRAVRLEHKRRLWVYGLIDKLNQRAEGLQPGDGPLLKYPPYPPVKWWLPPGTPPPSRDETLRRERVEWRERRRNAAYGKAEVHVVEVDEEELRRKRQRSMAPSPLSSFFPNPDTPSKPPVPSPKSILKPTMVSAQTQTSPQQPHKRRPTR